MIIYSGSYLCCPNCKTILFKVIRDIDTTRVIRANDVICTKYNKSPLPHTSYTGCWHCGLGKNLHDLLIINNLYYI